MKLLSFFLIQLFLFGCTSYNTENLSSTLHVKTSDSPLLLSDYFNGIKAIAFDENEMIGNIDKIVLTDSLLILSDFYLEKSLKVFDRNGKLISSKLAIGEGPGELSEISDFEVYKDKIYVLVSVKRSIYVYDLALNFENEIRIDHAAGNLLINEHGIFLYSQNYDPENLYKIFVYNFQDDKTISLIPYDFENKYPYFSGSFLIKINNRSFLQFHPSMDSIYIIHDQSVKSYWMDFQGDFMDDSKNDGLHPLEQLKSHNDFQGYKGLRNGIRVNDNEFLFQVIHRNKLKYLKINLHKSEALVFDALKNDLDKLPSKVIFSGNSVSHAWYLQRADDLQKFYSLNKGKINLEDQIVLPKDLETQLLFVLEYK